MSPRCRSGGETSPNVLLRDPLGADSLNFSWLVPRFEDAMAVMNLKLLIVQGRPAGKHLSLSRGDYYIGRGPECKIRLDSELVSRQHCLLRISADTVMIRDLASRNGTLVNGKLVEGERPLLTGDLVQIGTLVFEVQYDDVTMAPETVNKHAEPTAQIEARPTDHHENETDVPLEMPQEKPEVK
jgi:pSer/pThr/pTyr-binding forkhead associated (FHA) protein